MFWRLIAALVSVLVVSAGVSAQPKGKETDLKELEQLVEDLRPKQGKFLQITYPQLMSRRPLPKELIPALTKIMTTEKGYPRTVAAALLAEITPTDASLVPILQEGLAAKEQTSGVAAINALERMGPLAKPARPQILAALESGPIQVKLAAIPVVAAMGKEALEPLEKMIHTALNMKAKNKYLQRHDHAAMALGKIGSDALPTILRFFDADDPGLEYHAAVALKAMDKKPIEALKPMLRLLRSKDSNVRRLVIPYLEGITPPTDAVMEALYGIMNDPNSVLISESYQAARKMPNDPKKWSPVLVKFLLSHPGHIGALRELYRVDRPQARQLMLPLVTSFLRGSTKQPNSMAHLALLEEDIVPLLPQLYRIMNEPAAKSASARQNLALLLFSLPPEHSLKVQKQLTRDLDAADDIHKLYAARALLRTKPTDKTGIARVLGQAVVSGKFGGFTSEEVLDDLRRLGAEGRPAHPLLRIAVFENKGSKKLELLRTLAAIDPDQKDAVAAIARKMHESNGPESLMGTALLHELGGLSDEATLKVLREAVEMKGHTVLALALVREMGPKAKALVPQLESMLGQPKYLYRAPTILAIGQIDGDPTRMLDRLTQLAREPNQFDRVLEAFEVLGPEARSALPALLELRDRRLRTSHVTTMVRLVDPRLIGEFLD